MCNQNYKYKKGGSPSGNVMRLSKAFAILSYVAV